MKKNKNETVKKKAEETNNTVKNNILPENPDENKNEEYPFRKVLYGYNPDEVASFIDELSKTHETSAKLHEEKLSSIKEELALSNRERDYYIEKCKKLQSEAKSEPSSPSVEAKKIISGLAERIKALENENAYLKNNSTAKSDNNTEMYILKISELEEKNSQLKQQAEKFSSLSDENKALKIKLGETSSLLEHKEKELDEKNSEIKEKNETIIALGNENSELKKKNSDIEIQNSVLARCQKENEEEIIKLKEINKAVVFENAEKLNALETEHAKIRLAAQKELKLYGYYVDRAELTIAELTKQMEQFRQSIEKSEI